MADQVIRTQRLEIVDERGRVRASIGQQQDTFGVELVDDVGQTRLFLNLHEDGQPGFFMSNGDNIVVSLGIGDHGVHFHLMDHSAHCAAVSWTVDDDGAVRHHMGPML